MGRYLRLSTEELKGCAARLSDRFGHVL